LSRPDAPAATFEAPWQAQAFAITVALQERGLFTWTQWTSALASEIERARTTRLPDDDSTYYEQWLAAIEHLVVDLDVVTTEELRNRREAWVRATHSTPHGQPILLSNDPLR
jgi:nitrile hydratase accessory protein